MNRSLIFSLIVYFTLTGQAFTAEAQGHHHHGDQKAAVKIKPGKKYESDAPLRSHMGAIREELQSKMSSVHSNKFKAKDYQALSTKIDLSIQSIFKDCKLEAEADAALHHILAEMMAGSSAMKNGTTSDARAQGLLKVTKGLENYSQTFIDTTWKPLKI